MTRTVTYLLIQELNATDLNSVQRHLSKIIEELTLLLNDLRERQCLTDIQVQQMTVHQLRTIINHDNDIEPHGLSFISDHPPVMYSTLIQACLMCAALIRSKVSDFHNECRDVEIVFLNNGYSMNFIKEHIEQLFQDFHISNWKSNLNQNTYDKMREEIIEYDQQHQEMKIKQR
ncbi:unnamed protein product [Rotaria sp. Silwood1]|nr:unnamed protein product [Rotaria sp. Silwood1]CAF1566724.1 unnamed protein product [Rotaria sp. Silwood1]CAF3634224.1 unnamed protein product [Rotaria sp. Silwood1]